MRIDSPFALNELIRKPPKPFAVNVPGETKGGQNGHLFVDVHYCWSARSLGSLPHPLYAEKRKSRGRCPESSPQKNNPSMAGKCPFPPGKMPRKMLPKKTTNLVPSFLCISLAAIK
jgi:hypothetical protein